MHLSIYLLGLLWHLISPGTQTTHSEITILSHEEKFTVYFNGECINKTAARHAVIKNISKEACKLKIVIEGSRKEIVKYLLLKPKEHLQLELRKDVNGKYELKKVHNT